jgi:hypothetical protein
MTTKPRALGNHAFFFRDETAFSLPAPGTSGRESKPDGADTGWIDFGIVSSMTVTNEGTKEEVFAPSPGPLRRWDVIEHKKQIDLGFTVDEMSPFMAELLFGTAPLTGASTQYNPGEGGAKKGWLRVKQYDSNDVLVNTLEIYVHLAIDGQVEFGESYAKFSVKAMGLTSSLNTGALAV